MVLGRGAVSYEQGTPVIATSIPLIVREHVLTTLPSTVQSAPRGHTPIPLTVSARTSNVSRHSAIICVQPQHARSPVESVFPAMPSHRPLPSGEGTIQTFKELLKAKARIWP
jgi:hypothetical protein